ncbi:Inheritance of peroxisomes 1 protein [Rutstroemia sp. NJR-2017a WRK4]|nr:Inheritance of peroxisomes 1 protein [Rutstroemia sp. NJR-2017a WRK4]
MALPIASKTPANSTNRSVSAAGRLTTTPDPEVKILYSVPEARIISFSTSASTAARPRSSNGPTKQEVEEVGALPWSSSLERTIAVGTLRIYRAPESVAFFNCQQALKPILPRSQCWFVSDDGSSKFVLQVRKLQEYWRIEIRNRTSEEIKQVEEFKEILAQVLLFEKTPCPFERNFSVELADVPQLPITKKPWRPVQGSLSGVPLPRGDYYPIASKISVSSADSPSISSTEPRLPHIPQLSELHEDHLSLSSPINSDVSKPDAAEYGPDDLLDRPVSSLLPGQGQFTPAAHDIDDSTFSSSTPHDLPRLEIEEHDEVNDAADDANVTSKNQAPVSQNHLGPNHRPAVLQKYSRCVTAPPVLSLITSPPSKHHSKSPSRDTALADPESSFSSSVESFHSVQSWHSPLDPPSPLLTDPPSPTITTYPYPHDNIVLPKKSHPTHATSELHITPETPGLWQAASIPDNEASSRSLSSPPRTPTLISDGEKSEDESFEITTPSPPRMRHRATTGSNSRRRTLSPLPAAVNLFSPPRNSRRLQTARHLPTAIIQKTCEILLTPPSHLLNMMVNIASKIAAGEWRGFLLGEGEAVHWDFTEDDYGCSLAPAVSDRKAISQYGTSSGGSWEVD